MGKSTDVDGEDTKFRRCVSEPEWTRVRPSLYQKSVIDYITRVW